MYTTYDIFCLIALIIVGFQILRWFCRFIYTQLIGPFLLQSRVDIKSLGKWAVVTGSTDGIGLAYAEYLASLGINIVLISRSLEKLQNTAATLEEQYKIQTKVIEADFSQPEIYKDIEKVLWGYEIGILVNNVGLSYPHPELFLDLPCKEKIFNAIIHCNIFSVTKMCMLVMPSMLERKRGLIINLSSTTAHIPSPMLTVYGASKAYISKFSADLAAEYGKKGITIQCLSPGYVATKMSKIKKSTWMAPSPKDYVRNAIKYVGVVEKCTGYYPHSILLGVTQILESWSLAATRFIIMHMMQTIRMRAIKRYVG